MKKTKEEVFDSVISELGEFAPNFTLAEKSIIFASMQTFADQRIKSSPIVDVVEELDDLQISKFRTIYELVKLTKCSVIGAVGFTDSYCVHKDDIDYIFGALKYAEITDMNDVRLIFKAINETT